MSKPIVLEGELELHADYEGQQIYVGNEDVWGLLADSLTPIRSRNIYEDLYGPVRITIEVLAEEEPNGPDPDAAYDRLKQEGKI